MLTWDREKLAVVMRGLCRECEVGCESSGCVHVTAGGGLVVCSQRLHTVLSDHAKGTCRIRAQPRSPLNFRG